MAKHNLNLSVLKTSLMALLALHSEDHLSGLVRLDASKTIDDNQKPIILLKISFLGKNFLIYHNKENGNLFYDENKNLFRKELEAFINMKHKYFSSIKQINKSETLNKIGIHFYAISMEDANNALSEGKLAKALLDLRS